MFCARCGKEIPQGYSFCPNCGAQVARTVMPDPQNNAQQAVNTAADYTQQAANNAANYTQQTAGNAGPYIQQAASNVNPYAQQAAQNTNPYVQQGAMGYGQRPGPNAGGYTQQYGQAPQMNYQQNQQMNWQQTPQMNYSGQQSFTVPEKKSKKGLMIGIIAAAVIAIAAILLFVWPGFLSGGGGASTPEKTVKNFGTALQKLDFNGMIKCFDPESQKKLNNTIDQLGDLNLGGLDLSSLIEMMNLKVNMDVTNVDYNSDRTRCTAYVNIKMSYSFLGYSDSNEESTSLEMVNEGGKWYIDGSSMDLEDMLGDLMGGIY